MNSDIMAPPPSIPMIDVILTADNIKDVVQKVVSILRPSWDCEKAVGQRNFQGFVNITVIISRDGVDMSDALVLRTLSEEYGGPVSTQQQVHRFLNDHQLGPAMLAFINNGVCMEFVRGRVLKWSEWERLGDPMVWKGIARCLARWHQKKLYNLAVESKIPEQKYLLWGPVVEKDWDAILSKKGMEEYRSGLPGSEELLREERDVIQRLQEAGDLDKAFCHLDVNVSNVGLEEKSGEITFIDFDFASISYIQLDLTWYFHIYQDIEHFSSENYPSEEYRRAFLHEYLQHRKRLDGEPDVTSQEIDRLLIQLDKMRLIQYLRNVVDGPCMFNSSGSTLFIGLSKDCWAKYKQVKESVLALKSS